MIQPQPKSYGNISNLAIQSVFSITSGSGKDHSKTPPHLLPDLNPIMTTHGGVIIESIGGGGEMMGGNTTNTCEICGKQFTLRTNLTAHKKLHVRGATTCKWCSKTLSTIGNLRSHIQYVHANAPHPPRRHYTPRSGIHRKAYGSVSRQHRPPSGSSQDTDLDPLHFLDGIELNEGGGVIIPDSVAHQESTTSS